MTDPDTVQHTIESIIESLRQGSIVIGDQFQSELSQSTLYEKINGIVTGLRKLYAESSELNVDPEIPVEFFTVEESQSSGHRKPQDAIGYVDHGRNPDLFTKKVLDLCVQQNQITSGKVHVIRALRDNIRTELARSLPQEVASCYPLTVSSETEKPAETQQS